MTEEEQKKKEQEQSQKNVANFLYGIIVFASAGLVTKLAWNLGMASLFPSRFPTINYSQAITWLTMLYIVARVVAAGFMAEIERSVANALDHLGKLVDMAQNIINTANVKVTETRSDPTNLN